LEIYNDSKNEKAFDKISSIVCDSGVDTGDLDNPTICSYHGHVLRKN